jgi:Rieske Fe-S protein
MPEQPGPTRRAVLQTGTAAIVVSLSGCQTYGAKAPAKAAATGGDGTKGGSFTKTADIPVGGGKIFDAESIVVTQPSAGEFVGFSAVCTHAGCVLASVSGATINCDCHGSKFKIADGSVARGPATQPLSTVKITVAQGQISRG